VFSTSHTYAARLRQDADLEWIDLLDEISFELLALVGGGFFGSLCAVLVYRELRDTGRGGPGGFCARAMAIGDVPQRRLSAGQTASISHVPPLWHEFNHFSDERDAGFLGMGDYMCVQGEGIPSWQ